MVRGLSNLFPRKGKRLRKGFVRGDVMAPMDDDDRPSGVRGLEILRRTIGCPSRREPGGAGRGGGPHLGRLRKAKDHAPLDPRRTGYPDERLGGAWSCRFRKRPR